MNWGRIALIGLLGAVLLAGSPGRAADSRYSPWQPPAQPGGMADLLKNLRSLIDEAERSKAADPTFLGDLRALANSYDNPWPVKLVYDDFRDGDFTSNPPWTVSAGIWRVDTRGRFNGLRSTVYGPDTGNDAPGAGGQNLAGNTLGGLLQQQGGRPSDDEFAAIFLPLTISNSFAIRLEIASRDDGGRFDFGPYLGQRGNTAYRITYQSGAANGLVLSQVTRQGVRVLAGTSGPVDLEDGKSHTIDWKRDRSGKMTVALDGRPVIEANDPTIRKPFDGFLMVNGGGTYWIRSVAISGAR
jgi:hypothetical protein